ncbi:hypothetical protein BGW39_003580, partial [Mortierella sp. 14UC]
SCILLLLAAAATVTTTTGVIWFSDSDNNYYHVLAENGNCLNFPPQLDDKAVQYWVDKPFYCMTYSDTFCQGRGIQVYPSGWKQVPQASISSVECWAEKPCKEDCGGVCGDGGQCGGSKAEIAMCIERTKRCIAKKAACEARCLTQG